MKVFASELSKCRVFKALFGWLAVIFGFMTFVVFPILWILKAPIEKTDLDFAREYLYKRMVFSPNTVNEAYFNELQYQFPLYTEATKEEINYLKESKVYQSLILNNLSKVDKNSFKANGILVRISCKEKDICEKVMEKNVIIYLQMVKKFKFVIQNIEEEVR